MSFIVYNSPEVVKEVLRATVEVTEHFQSSKLAEQFMNGIIDWDGNPVCDIHGSKPCNCLKIDW